MTNRFIGKSLDLFGVGTAGTQAFNDRYYQGSLVPVRVMLIVGIALYGAVFVAIDRAMLPPEAFWRLAWIRIILSTAMGFVIGVSYLPWFRRVWQGVLAFSITLAAVGAGTVLFVIRNDDPYVNLISPTFALFAMLTFTAFRLSLGWAVAAGLVQIAAFNVCATGSGAVESLALVGHNAVLGAAFLMGGVLNWQLWRYERRDFALIEEIGRERERSEQLLLNVLPGPVAVRLKAGEENIADAYPEATVLFADIVNFTEMTAKADDMVRHLNRIFTAFDGLADKHGLEKIKTIGDAYMVVASVPTPRADHAEATTKLALDMLCTLSVLRDELKMPIHIRVGIHTGPLVAGVIGKRKFSFDIWGDTVNTASRMESHGVADAVQISEAMFRKVGHLFECHERGIIQVKGKGPMRTYLITGSKSTEEKTARTGSSVSM